MGDLAPISLPFAYQRGNNQRPLGLHRILPPVSILIFVNIGYNGYNGLLLSKDVICAESNPTALL